ncbi:hypothetical protein [Nocardia yamanashiensis]|uniref:hypothetical protein n=1 Tax=Nocardia yamanashiensis TaxID=209247 RepID=UPI0012FDF3D1|nr:hypothetical protein [Nocardia yamanashiensis]
MSGWIEEGTAADDQDVAHLIEDLHYTGDWTLCCTGTPARAEPKLGRPRWLRCSLKAAEAFRLSEQPLSIVQEWMRVDHTAHPRPSTILSPPSDRRGRPPQSAQSAEGVGHSAIVFDLSDPDLRYVLTDSLSRWATLQRRKARAESDASLTETRRR